MSFKFPLLALVLLLNVQCKTQGTSTKQQPSKTTSTEMQSQGNEENTSKLQTIRIQEGKTETFSDLKMNITMRSIKEDSRCPEGVQCVWQGVAVAEIEFMSVHARPRTADLATLNLEAKGYNNSFLYDGKVFTLKSITPSKEKRTEKTPYVVELTVENYNGTQKTTTNPASSRGTSVK